MPQATANKVRNRIRKVFGADLEIVDAKHPLRLQPMRGDEIGADPKCPDNCLLVHTAARMFGSKAAIFWRTSAYIDLVGKDGIRRIERFINPKGTIESIIKFDHGDEFPSAGLVLLPPSHFKTLKHRRKTSREYSKTSTYMLLQKLERAKRTSRQAELKSEQKNEALSEMRKHLTVSSPRMKLAVKDAKAARDNLERARDKVEILRKQAEQVRTAKKYSHDPSPLKFDITTRNGATGNYKFSSE